MSLFLRMLKDKLEFEDTKLSNLTKDAGLDPSAKQRKALYAAGGFKRVGVELKLSFDERPIA
jgi:hypothetical protein